MPQDFWSGGFPTSLAAVFIKEQPQLFLKGNCLPFSNPASVALVRIFDLSTR
jgi:hypothetical protein